MIDQTAHRIGILVIRERVLHVEGLDDVGDVVVRPVFLVLTEQDRQPVLDRKLVTAGARYTILIGCRKRGPATRALKEPRVLGQCPHIGAAHGQRASALSCRAPRARCTTPTRKSRRSTVRRPIRSNPSFGVIPAMITP